MKCIGLYGYLFGHNYEGVYNKTTEELTVDEKILLSEKADEMSRGYDYITAMSQILIDAAEKPKKKENIYVYHICIRCGDIKNKS